MTDIDFGAFWYKAVSATDIQVHGFASVVYFSSSVWRLVHCRLTVFWCRCLYSGNGCLRRTLDLQMIMHAEEMAIWRLEC